MALPHAHFVQIFFFNALECSSGTPPTRDKCLAVHRNLQVPRWKRAAEPRSNVSVVARSLPAVSSQPSRLAPYGVDALASQVREQHPQAEALQYIALDNLR